MLFPKPHRRPKRRRDSPSDEEVAAVFARDKGCIAAQIDPSHECRDTIGWPHRWDDLRRLTMEHVQERYGRAGRRAKSDRAHMVAMCGAGNLFWGPTHRPTERLWIALHSSPPSGPNVDNDGA